MEIYSGISSAEWNLDSLGLSEQGDSVGCLFMDKCIDAEAPCVDPSLGLNEKKVQEVAVEIFARLSEESERGLERLVVERWNDVCYYFPLVVEALSNDSCFISDLKILQSQSRDKSFLGIRRLAEAYDCLAQNDYSMYLHAGIVLGAKYRERYQKSFWWELLFFSAVRQIIAKILYLRDCDDKKVEEKNVNYCRDVGLPRVKGEKVTRMDRFYKAVPEKMERRILRECPLGEVEQKKQEFSAGNYVCKTKVMIDDKVVLLSIIPIFPNQSPFVHASPDVISSILNAVKSFYESAVLEEDRDRVIKLCAEIYWGICQASPWKFGEPSIAEMLFRSIWEMKGMENPSWTDDVIPWQEVVTTLSSEEFVEIFPSLFKWGRRVNIEPLEGEIGALPSQNYQKRL